MGEFSLSGNASIGLSGVEISVNNAGNSKATANTIFYTTPTSEAASIHQAQPRPAMQDELSEKAAISSSTQGGDELGVTAISSISAITASSAPDKPKDCDSNSNVDLTDKLPEHVTPQATKQAPAVLGREPLFHPADANPSTPTPTPTPGPGPGQLWSTGVEDGYVHNLNVNGGLGFQNYSSQQPQLFGNQNQGRRAITAAHNFPHNVVRQQSSHPLFKSYGSWTNPGQGSWSGGSAWNRGRSVPNLTPLQQIGVGNRKPSPTFNHQQPQAISPVKFRRSTSYPGKGHFQQPPTFEITATDEPRELLSYQDRCGVNANGSSPLDTMRGLEHYLNDFMRQPTDTSDLKGLMNCNTNAYPSLTHSLHGKSPYFGGLDEQAGPVLLEEPGHLVDSSLGGGQPLSSPSRSSPHSQGSEGGERFSRKVFVGGLPPDIDEDEITNSFRRFGPLVVDWPHKAESKSYFPPKGYAFLLFQDENSVQSLIDACITDEDKLYLCVSSPTIKDKPVQIRPWRLSDADFVLDASMPLDPRKTVFVGGVPRPLKAVELAMIMDRLYGGVCYAGIDTDPELKYPKGAGRVAFSNQQSYIAAISARFVQLQHGDIDKRVEVKPYVLDDQMCDECQGQRCGGKFAPFFCANVTCLQYYCEHCWATIHSRPGREFHKPLVKEGADRPRAVPFRWC
ncbi:cytoplasmic polyadenylation element-binding protein 2 [Onthophagus taurus]|uniref:cytoplasmic polyadenylation element-binding protein 2 n=1 Tax=Onthophagus taurus TaxID=166361 RepID=UPI000C209C44|nr:cytoplasmic polyadenylation element-binding protein 2 [Onthophagus taurus]